jgi:hypothetical protein
MGKNGFIKSIKVVSLSLAIASQSLKALFPLKNGRRLRSKFVIYGNYKVERLRNTLKQLSGTVDNLAFSISTKSNR